MAEEHVQEAGTLIEGEGGYDYLARSIAIVTMLYERGIIQELLESGRITTEEIEQRLAIIREKYNLARTTEIKNEFGGNTGEEDGIK